jgi:hypothetical protein
VRPAPGDRKQLLEDAHALPFPVMDNSSCLLEDARTSSLRCAASLMGRKGERDKIAAAMWCPHMKKEKVS